MPVAYSKPWVTRALVCPSCPSISFSGGHSLPHPQKPTKCLQSGLGLPHLPHLPETFFHSLLAGQPHDHFGYPQYSFSSPFSWHQSMNIILKTSLMRHIYAELQVTQDLRQQRGHCFWGWSWTEPPQVGHDRPCSF